MEKSNKTKSFDNASQDTQNTKYILSNFQSSMIVYIQTFDISNVKKVMLQTSPSGRKEIERQIDTTREVRAPLSRTRTKELFGANLLSIHFLTRGHRSHGMSVTCQPTSSLSESSLNNYVHSLNWSTCPRALWDISH